VELLLLPAITLAAGSLVLVLLRQLDRRRLDRSGTVFLFVFPLVGALSVVPGFVLYAASALVFPPVQAGRWGQILFVWTVNAPVEELAKYLCFAVAAHGLRSLREPRDGVLQGAATGLGFGLVENFLYGLSGGWVLLLVRTLVSLPGHVIYGAVWGGYHGFEVYQGKGRVVRWWVPLLALVPAAFSHATYNTFALLGSPLAVTLAADVLTLGFGVFLYRRLGSALDLRLPLKEWRRALPDLEHALALNPRSAVLRRRLAAYLLAGSQPARALSVLEPLGEDPWTLFYRDAARSRLDPELPLPLSSRLNPRLFRALSGA
jgi:RsiW-degrading membrane proteinase PrsW (M82 family)